MKISKPIIIDGEEFVTTRNTNEQRKGKWLDGCQYGMSGTYWYRYCSECGYTREDDNIDKDSNYCPNCGAIMDTCENTCEITRKSNANQWIPCEERLPEKKGFYLVTTEERKTATMGFYEDIWFKTEKVIAWMPLPKPYEGRTE